MHKAKAMKKVIIAIHGLGNKPPKDQLQKWGRMAIEEGIDNLGAKVKLSEFELVYWADLLYDKPQTTTEKDKESPYFLDEVYTKAPKNYKVEPHEIRRKFQDYFKSLAYKIFLKNDYHLRYAFVSQKLIHKYFYEMEVYFEGDSDFQSDFNYQVKQEIIRRLSETLKKYKNYKVMLIAHSMGSIIAFDVLSFVAQQSRVDTLVTMGAPLGAPFVMSRIAAHSKSTYGQIKLQIPEAVQKHWYNFSDIRDKIALDYKLSDDFAPNSKGVKVVDKLVTNKYVMNGLANPHKSFGYLRTPEFIEVLKAFSEGKKD
ncbi:MAG: hypothetical protein DRI89_06890 [Bacteroidetes bacterium]|nr:MAG: hypothetical protein DRI89_06890 [Bacteroidota bacterium]